MRRGFTVVELLIYMGIFATIMLVLSQIFQNSTDLLIDSRADSSVSEDANYLLARFGYDVRRASAIALPATIGQSGSALRLTIGGIPWEFAFTDNHITLTTGGQTETLTTQMVTDFLVTRTTEGVQLTWTLESVEAPVGGLTSTQSFQTTLAPR